MGAGQSTSSSPHARVQPPTSALHVLRIAPRSPAASTDLEAWFDFILGVDVDGLDATADLERAVEENEGRLLELVVWSSKTRQTRLVPITPSRAWSSTSTSASTSKPSLLGLSMRICAPSHAQDAVWHVLDVLEGSPAESAGLVPYGDWIVGWSGGPLQREQDFYDVVEMHEEKPLRVYVYSYDFDTLREVVLVPNRVWGGAGLLGCVFGFGLLHRIPEPPPPELDANATFRPSEEDEYDDREPLSRDEHVFVPADEFADAEFTFPGSHNEQEQELGYAPYAMDESLPSGYPAVHDDWRDRGRITPSPPLRASRGRITPSPPPTSALANIGSPVQPTFDMTVLSPTLETPAEAYTRRDTSPPPPTALSPLISASSSPPPVPLAPPPSALSPPSMSAHPNSALSAHQQLSSSFTDSTTSASSASTSGPGGTVGTVQDAPTLHAPIPVPASGGRRPPTLSTPGSVWGTSSASSPGSGGGSGLGGTPKPEGRRGTPDGTLPGTPKPEAARDVIGRTGAGSPSLNLARSGAGSPIGILARRGSGEFSFASHGRRGSGELSTSPPLGTGARTPTRGATGTPTRGSAGTPTRGSAGTPPPVAFTPPAHRGAFGRPGMSMGMGAFGGSRMPSSNFGPAHSHSPTRFGFTSHATPGDVDDLESVDGDTETETETDGTETEGSVE